VVHLARLSGRGFAVFPQRLIGMIELFWHCLHVMVMPPSPLHSNVTSPLVLARRNMGNI
jgi:hypothetical protein